MQQHRCLPTAFRRNAALPAHSGLPASGTLRKHVSIVLSPCVHGDVFGGQKWGVQAPTSCPAPALELLTHPAPFLR